MADPQGNGFSDNEKRLQRIEHLMAHNFEEHDIMKSELKLLIRSQGLMTERQDILDRQFRVKMDETTDKLNGLIAAIELSYKEFHERIARREG